MPVAIRAVVSGFSHQFSVMKYPFFISSHRPDQDIMVHMVCRSPPVKFVSDPSVPRHGLMPDGADAVFASKQLKYNIAWWPGHNDFEDFARSINYRLVLGLQ